MLHLRRPTVPRPAGRRIVSHVMAVMPSVTVVVLSTLVAGCGGDSGPTSQGVRSSRATPSESASPSDPATSSAPTATDSREPRRGTVVTTADSAYGPMLFDRSGQAIYLFDRETTSTPQCSGACAQAWPPVLTQGQPGAAGAVRPRLLGTTRRADGSLQVTYDGHPLYFYAHEGKHEVLCHNVSEFGGVWLVVTPGGEPAA